jgi:hypothetical protein
MMLSAPAEIPDQITRLLPLLSSPVDAEALGACRAIDKKLKAAGLDSHSIVASIERSGETNTYRGREPDPDDWRGSIRWCLAQEERLTDWEGDFLAGLSGWIGPPTRRQMDRLETIAKKIRGAA